MVKQIVFYEGPYTCWSVYVDLNGRRVVECFHGGVKKRWILVGRWEAGGTRVRWWLLGWGGSAMVCSQCGVV